MDCGSRNLEGVILSREEMGEAYLRLRVFSRAEGLLVVLKRLPSKRSPVALPDLFDVLEFCLGRSLRGGVPFMGEWRILRRRHELACGRERLEAASALASLYLENGAHLPEPGPVSDLLSNALDSLVSGLCPVVTHLKALYLFVQAEGWPVKESWRRSLSPEEGRVAAETLNVPLREVVQPNDDVVRLLESLRQWVNLETEMRC